MRSSGSTPGGEGYGKRSLEIRPAFVNVVPSAGGGRRGVSDRARAPIGLGREVSMPITEAETRPIAEKILSSAFGGPVRLGAGTNLSDRPHVFRFEMLDGPAS